MTRPIRVDVEGGWYHVTARGTERRAIFEAERDYEHFLELIEGMIERYSVEVHAYCLMSNHYHMLIRTPHANASKAMQWLNVSYSAWFNRKRGRVGHVFQGRFGSVLIDDKGTWCVVASVYIHLNPIRVAGERLGKSHNKAERAGLMIPSEESLRKRLKKLREYRWSSFCAYGGYKKEAGWLNTEELLKRSGGRREYRRYVQMHVTRGAEPEGYENWKGRLALGTRKFQEDVAQLVKHVTKEQPQRKCLRRQISTGQIVKLVEKKKGESWDKFSLRYGDWGRDLILYLSRIRTGLTLKQIGEQLGGIEYKAVGKAVQRFKINLKKDVLKRKFLKECLNELSNVET